MKLNLSLIPQDLIEHNHWVLWRFLDKKKDDGTVYRTKVPISPVTGDFAKSNDPKTWSSFERMTNCHLIHDGIGFMITKELGIVGVDLDDCRNLETGEIDEESVSILSLLNSYSEISPTGTGTHTFIYADLPPGRRRKGNVEMYNSGRFFTVSADPLPDFPPWLERRQDEIDYLHQQLFGKPEKRENNHISVNIESDLDLISKAINSRMGRRFADLFNGMWHHYYPSQSEADAKLCRMLAYWCKGDRNRIDRLFRMSSLYRPKWDISGYRERTISYATGA